MLWAHGARIRTESASGPVYRGAMAEAGSVPGLPSEREGSDALSADGLPEPLQMQWRLCEQWIQSDAARRTAGRLIARRGLQQSADDLVNEAWLRLRGTFRRRTEPYPRLDTIDDVSRFGARLLDNLTRDWLRSRGRRREVALADTVVLLDPGTDGVEQRHIVEQLVYAVGRRSRQPLQCSGCPDETVVAAALELLHLVLAGHPDEGDGRQWLDRMLYEAFDRLDDVERSEAARAQRKSRCGRCVMALLESAWRDLGGGVP